MKLTESTSPLLPSLVFLSLIFFLSLWFQVRSIVHSSRSSVTSASGVSVNSASSMESLDSVLRNEADGQQGAVVPSAEGGSQGHMEVDLWFYETKKEFFSTCYSLWISTHFTFYQRPDSERDELSHPQSLIPSMRLSCIMCLSCESTCSPCSRCGERTSFSKSRPLTGIMLTLLSFGADYQEIKRFSR